MISFSRNQFAQVFAFVFAAALFQIAGQNARAQLTWGIGGAGGPGTWDRTTADWYNGATNVTWDGSQAIFAGAAATVTVATDFNLSATAITFNVAGYTLQNGWLNSNTSASSLVINSNANATISTTIGNGGASGELAKNGTATLVLSGTDFYKTLQVNAGEVQSGGSSDFFFSRVNLANVAGATVTLGSIFSNESMGGLSGGGSNGGVVQPGAASGAKTLNLDGGGAFAGVLQDNGANKLALTLFAVSQTQTLTAANSYSGATNITSGTLALGGNGSALNTASVAVAANGVLKLDNASAALSNRLSNSAAVSISGGSLQMIGNASSAVTQALGNLNFSGAATVNVTQSGPAAQLNFSGVTRVSHGALDVPGTGGVQWTGVVNTYGALIAPYVTAGNEWATVSGNGNVAALSIYATNINAGSATDDVKVTGGGTTTVSAATTRNSLNLQNSSGSAGILDLNGNGITLTSGGLLTSGTSASQIQNGVLQPGGNEIVITNRNALNITANIHESVSGSVLTKSGAGALTLSGTNTYSGNTELDAGTLIVFADSALGVGAAIEFNGGKFQAGASFVSGKGLQSGTSLSGNIDTNGFNVSFSGANTGSINKVGAGTLTETAGATGNTVVSGGIFALPNAASGSSTLAGGTLRAAGTLDNVTFSLSPSTLDIGGSAAATLTTTSFGSNSSGSLTVEFGLGSGPSDLWNITHLSVGPQLSYIYDIQNLGGLATGTDYVLMKGSGFGSLTASNFALSSADIASGMTASFKVSPSQVTVNFTTVPEPGSVSLLFSAFAGWGASLRFRRRP